MGLLKKKSKNLHVSFTAMVHLAEGCCYDDDDDDDDNNNINNNMGCSFSSWYLFILSKNALVL
jgi:hypothetical protein